MEFNKEKEEQEIRRLYDELGKTWDDKEYDNIYEFNDKYFEEYCDYLKNIKHLSEKTIDRHYSHVSFFVNEHLTRYLEDTIFSPADSLEDFFGYFLLYKCLFTTKYYITTSCACIKSFYKFMAEKGYVEKKVYEDVVMNIDEGKERWVKELWKYEHGQDERTLFYKALEESEFNNDN